MWLTFRELFIIVQAIDDEEQQKWMRAANIMAIIHNVNHKKSQQKSPKEFMPKYFEEEKGDKMSEKEVRKGYKAINRGWEKKATPKKVKQWLEN